MAGRSVSGYVDEAVVERLGALARAEDRTPASIVGQALGFYTTLPESARIALRRLDQLGSAEERGWVLGELTRLLLRADMSLTQRVMVAEMGDALPSVSDEAALEDHALAWTAPEGR